MRLTQERIVLTCDEPFVSNRGVTTHVDQRIVRLEWEGLTGYGTSLVATADAIAECAAAVEESETPYAVHRILEALDAAGVAPGVVAAIDLALHDLIGKAVERPVRELFGLAELPLPPTGLSLGTCSEQELRERGSELSAWPILKLKMTAADDGRRAGALREVYDGRIWVDGNGSWTPEGAVAVARELHRHGVELLEQPVPPGSPDALRHVHERSPIAIVADEDCTTPDDVLDLRGCVGVVNVKLSKCGGLRAAHETILLARHCGLRVMLGCKTESALGVTAMAQLGGLADYLDLDGQLRLVDDPFRGATIERGVVALGAEPGLGAAHADALVG